MAGISKGAVIQLILSYIGGNPLFQVPTTTVGGQPVAIQAGFGGAGGLISQAVGLASEAASLASQAAGFASMSGNMDLASSLNSLTGQLSTISVIGSQAEAVSQLSQQLGTLNDLTGQLSTAAAIAGQSAALYELNTGLGSLNSKSNDLSALNDKTSYLASVASDVGASSSGLTAGLSTISKNPLESKINNTKDTLLSYSSNSYQGLSLALPNITSNPSLNSAMANLKLSLGGPEGKTGAIGQLDVYKSHTDRLSGITLSSDSESYSPEESGQETIFYYDVPSNNFTEIISFSTKKIRSAKYFVQGSTGVDHQTSEVYIIHDSNTSFTREVGVIYTRNPFIKFTSKIVNNVLTVMANTTIPNVDIVVYGVKLQIASKSSGQDKISQEKILESAKSMTGFYPEDKTDYVYKQTSSLLNPSSLTALQESVDRLLVNLGNSDFNDLSTPQKEKKINDYADTINTLTTSMQSNIDLDITAQEEVSKKLESASVVFSLSSNYADPNAKALLDLTLQDSIKNSLQ